MALLNVDFHSDALNLSTSMTVLLPQYTVSQIGVRTAAPDTREGFPVLYLLHGFSDDHTAWLRNTSVERYVAPLGLAVVMPAVAHSFYADEICGLRYRTFVTEELPRVVGSFFRASQRREDTFVAGLSMGGYGAITWALREPKRFAAVASMSGTLDIHALASSPDGGRQLGRVFGEDIPADQDPMTLLRRVNPADAPRLHISCGTEDELLPGNRAFIDAATQQGLDVTVDLRPGEHEWGFWDRALRDVLSWLPLRGREDRAGDR